MTRHPAKFSTSLLPVMAEHLHGCWLALDPFAGVGGCHRLEMLVPGLTVIGNELEREWARQGLRPVLGNALHLPFRDGAFDAIVTSPTYGNRMADHHEAKDASRRNTYRHAIGRPLHPDNSGAMQWGPAYRAFHEAVWAECLRVLKPGGRFVVNVSDHIRKGEVMPVVQWHIDALQDLGVRLLAATWVGTPRQRFGANGELRVAHEAVLVAEPRPAAGEAA